MSTEAERITTTGERAPGGVPNLTPVQYTLACNPSMWPVAEELAAGIERGVFPKMTDPQLDALVATHLARRKDLSGFTWTGLSRVWCLTALAIKAQHVAGIARNPEFRP